MEKKLKIAIIGAGGRTGTMFSFVLRKNADILGVGKIKDIEMAKNGKIFIKQNEVEEKFQEKIILDRDFSVEEKPDIIFIATRNPVGPVIEYYFEKFKDNPHPPFLLLSQNGIEALEEAKKALQKIFPDNWQRVSAARVILFNAIKIASKNDSVYFQYSLPIKIALASAWGEKSSEEIEKIFIKSGIEVYKYGQKDVFNIEFSKLFLNLIGMACASHQLSIEEGLKNKEIFTEEVMALREYKKIVKMLKGNFLNMPHYPIKFYSGIIDLPISFLWLIKNFFAFLINSQRNKKEKDIGEFEFYNGAIVKLGKKLGINTPINEKIVARLFKLTIPYKNVSNHLIR